MALNVDLQVFSTLTADVFLKVCKYLASDGAP